MTDQLPPLPLVELSATDLAAVLRPRLAAVGFDVDTLSDDPVQIADLFGKLDNRERETVCELIALRAGRRPRDWPKWLDQVHDDALQNDAIDRSRKTLVEHLDAIISEVRSAHRAHEELQGDHGSGVWDVEHAEGGRHFEHALAQLAFYAETAKALNPTRNM